MLSEYQQKMLKCVINIHDYEILQGGEGHHKLPRCLGGSNSKYNKVRNHVLVHVALNFAFHHHGLAKAVQFMTNRIHNNDLC